MNLYGWSFQSFRDVLGSKNPSILKAATAHFAESQPDESVLARGKAWLQTLIETGYPLQRDCHLPTAPANGGLLTMQMETDTHAFAVYSLTRAIARDDHLDLSGESSDWAHPAASSLWAEVVACKFTRPESSDVRQWITNYVRWMTGLTEGTPLFGDAFRSQWSFYTWFSNEDLAAMVPVLQISAEFELPMPPNLPEEIRAKRKTRLSEGARSFIADLIKWFTRIQEAGQDAFILWW
jgi:hypothetical protein